jgi:hypothetical protein
MAMISIVPGDIPNKLSVVPEDWEVQLVPFEEVRIVPLKPTTTIWLPLGIRPRRSLVVPEV